MQIIDSISNLVSGITNVGPLKRLGSIARGFLDKFTGGRGLKLWSKPALREVKSKNEFTEFQLENGLKVIFKESKGTEISANLSFESGSAKDPKGKEGLAHFLEHVLLDNTKDFGKDIDEVIRINGGSSNGGTGTEATNYPLKLPRGKLDLCLRIFRSYFSEPQLEEDKVNKEKGIICSELKMLESKPAWNAGLKFKEMLYGKDHPLAGNIGGKAETVNSITKKDLLDFFKSEYVPNNAILTISGEFDKYQLKNQIKRYFSDLAANPKLVKPKFLDTLNPSKQRDHVLKDDSLVSLVSNAYRIPKFNHRDNLICGLLCKALGYVDVDGSMPENARLIRKLVDGESNASKAVALHVNSLASANREFGYFFIEAKPIEENREANLELIKATIDSELKDIAANGLTEKEFNRVVKELEAEQVYKLDMQHSGLGEVASYSNEGEDWTKALDKLKDIRSITNQDIKDFVSKYLVPSNRHRLTVIGKGDGLNEGFLSALKDELPIAKESGEDLNLTRERLERIKTLSGGVSNVATRLSNLQKFQHENGMQVYFKEDHSLPLAILSINFEGGTLAVPEEFDASLGMLVGLLAETGTYNPNTGKRFTKKDLDDMGTNLGASYSFDMELDHGSLLLSTLSKNTDKTLEMLSEVLYHPALLEENNPEIVKEVKASFERFKKQTLDMLGIFKKVPEMKTAETLMQSLYPKGHKCYQRSLDEAAELIKAVKLEDLRNIYKRIFNAQKAKITAVGDLSRDDINNKLIPILDNWNKDSKLSDRKADYSRVAPVKAKASQIKIVSSEDNKPEANVVIGNVAEIVEDSPEYYPALLANLILGAGPSSRLFNEIREDKSLVYHIGSSLVCFKNGSGPFSINLGCDPRNTKKTIAAVIASIRKFLRDGITQEELEVAKSQIKKSFAMGAFNSRAASCGTLSGLQWRDKDESFVNNFNSMIDAITVDQVNAAACKFIKPGNFSIVASKPKDFKFEALSKAPVKKAKLALAA